MPGIRGRSGGSRKGSGRKTKADEKALIEKLSPLDKSFFAAIKKGIELGEFNFCRLFADYRLGKPTERIEHSGEVGVNWFETKTYEANDQTDESS